MRSIFERKQQPERAETPLTTEQEIGALIEDIARRSVEAEELERESAATHDHEHIISLDGRAHGIRKLVGRLESDLVALRVKHGKERLAVRDAEVDRLIESEMATVQAAAEKLKALIPPFIAAGMALRGAGLRIWNRATPVGLTGDGLLQKVTGNVRAEEIFTRETAKAESEAVDYCFGMMRLQLERARVALKADARGQLDLATCNTEILENYMTLIPKLSPFERVTEPPEKVKPESDGIPLGDLIPAEIYPMNGGSA